MQLKYLLKAFSTVCNGRRYLLGLLLRNLDREKKKLPGPGSPYTCGRKQRDTDLTWLLPLLTDGISHSCVPVVQWWFRQLRASLFPMDQVTHWAWLMEQGLGGQGTLLLLWQSRPPPASQVVGAGLRGWVYCCHCRLPSDGAGGWDSSLDLLLPLSWVLWQ